MAPVLLYSGTTVAVAVDVEVRVALPDGMARVNAAEQGEHSVIFCVGL